MRYGTYTCGLDGDRIEFGYTFGEHANESDANTTGPCEIGDTKFDVVLGVVNANDDSALQVVSDGWAKYEWVALAIMEAASNRKEN